MAEFLTISQVASRLGVTVETLRMWTKEGKLRAVRTAGNHRRYRLEDVERFQARHGMADDDRQRPGDASGSRTHPQPTQPESKPTAGSWLESQLREARARTEILKARRDARALIEARAAELSQAASEAAGVRRREEHARRLEAMKEHGRLLALSAGLPAEWRARVTAQLERQVTAEAFPPSLPEAEAREYVRAHVETIINQHREQQERAAAIERRQSELILERATVQRLVEAGKTRASLSTLWWDIEDRERARREVARALQEQVEPDWDDEDVNDLVDDVLAEWRDEVGDEGEEDEGEEDEGADGEEEGET